MIGRLVGFAKDGAPLVDYPGNPSREPLSALSTVRFNDAAATSQYVTLLFADGDLGQPVVIGLVQPPYDEQRSVAENADERAIEASLDGKRIVLSAKHEIVLECGKASITLTRAGKVLIRGTHLSSHSSGANRIRGGSVELN